jgi:hypothetical protein
MGVMRSNAGVLIATALALAALGLSGGSWAEGHASSGARGSGGHSSGAARHGSASHVRSYARAGGYRAPAGGFRGQSPAHRQYTSPPAARAGYAASNGRSAGRGAYAPGYGRGAWGRAGSWRGYRGPYFGFVAAVPWNAYAFWWNGIPYYVADDTYYLWNDAADAYQIVPPPVDGNDADAGGGGGGGGGPDLSVYPSDGQSPEQQSSDRYDCYRWAADQTGFDPTRPAGGVQAGPANSAQDAYLRAEAACLQGRGYTVR